jgi:putative phosphoesterase
MSEAPIITVGVVADTHVPDRVQSLPPGLVDGLRAAGAAHILHAGDVCSQRVLDELGQVAPVSAVRGNRDFLIQPALPMALEIELGGVCFGVVHGHGGMRQYWLDKLGYITVGYRIERYCRVAERDCPRAGVWIYGHSHLPENRWIDGRLVFNPGAATGFRFGRKDLAPSYGILRVYPEGRVEGEIIFLHELEARAGVWASRQTKM